MQSRKSILLLTLPPACSPRNRPIQRVSFSRAKALKNPSALLIPVLYDLEITWLPSGELHRAKYASIHSPLFANSNLSNLDLLHTTNVYIRNLVALHQSHFSQALDSTQPFPKSYSRMATPTFSAILKTPPTCPYHDSIS